jgi:calpain-15
LVGASTGRFDVNVEEYRSAGIHANHAFSVLLATTLPISSSRFLLLRDPHGSTNYSDHSIKPAIRTQLHSLNEPRPSSGIFWIGWSNFLRFFDSLTISTYVSDHFDIREQAEFTRSPTQSVAAYYFHVSQ